MQLKDRIFKLRNSLHMSREQFAEEFGVSKQAVQKWESGTSYPELSKLIAISKRFDISLDALVLDRDMRTAENGNCIPRRFRLSTYRVSRKDLISKSIKTSSWRSPSCRSERSKKILPT